MAFLQKLFKSEDERYIKKLSNKVDEVFSLEEELKQIGEEELKQKSISLKNKIQDEIKIEVKKYEVNI